MKSRILYIATSSPFMAALTGPAVALEAAPDLPPEAFQRIEAYARQTMEGSGTAGVSLAVTSTEGTLFAAALGHADLKLARKVEPSTLFQIGSITKSFTSLALLSLAEEGKVDLDAPVSTYLPWFSIRGDYPAITARHLMNHSAGIPTNRDDFPSTPYMAFALREQTAAWAPGTQVLYSNVGYQVLHVLLETVAREPWAEVVRRRILDPLGMDQTEPEITFDNRDRQAIGYIAADGTRPAHRAPRLAEAPFFEYAMGDACVASTAADVAIYLRMLLNDGASGTDRIVSEDAFTQFVTPAQGTADGIGSGLGIEVDRRNGRFVLQHTGGMVGQSGFIKVDKQSGFGVVVLANGPGQTMAIADYAIDVLNAAALGISLPEIPASPGPHRIAKASGYAGRYQSPGQETLQVEARDESLWIKVADRMVPLERAGKDRFYCPEPGMDRYFLNFQRNPEGDVVSVTYGPQWFAHERYEGPLEFDYPPDWHAYTGKYHSQSPWFPGFAVFLRQGGLWCVTSGGGETSAGEETRLTPLGAGVFLPAPEPTPERVVFDEIINGQAWRASWSGHRFYRSAIYAQPHELR